MTDGIVIVGLLLALTLLRQGIILTLGVVVAYIHVRFSNNGSVMYLIQDIWLALDRELLLSLPMFMLAGVIMSRGTIAGRLVRIMSALAAPIPGGLGMAAVLSMAMFSSISGSGIVTMLAVGSLMFPALVRAGYSSAYAVGVLASGGTLGAIIPPSILMIVYGITTDVSITDMFVAGWGPGLLMVFTLCAYTVLVNRSKARGRLDARELFSALAEGWSALLMPVVLLGGIYSGYFTVTEAAAVSLFYALLVEVLIYRELDFRQIYGMGGEVVKLLGGLMPIIAIANSLNLILDYAGIPQAMIEFSKQYVESGWHLLVVVNLLLLVAGALMDETSAIVILAPLLAPLAASYGFDPVHFAMIVIVNMQIGYVMPPVAINLIVATSVFRQKFSDVCRAAVPFIGLMLIVLVCTVAFPKLSLFLIR